MWYDFAHFSCSWWTVICSPFEEFGARRLATMDSSRSSWLTASLMSVSAEGPTPDPPVLIRPSDLPIYAPNHVGGKKDASGNQESSLHAALLPPVRAVRQQVQELLKQTDSWKQTVVHSYNEAEARTSWIVKYLREEENKDVRYGAVAMGGLTGFVLGVRGGIIRKLFYATIGTSVMGAVCFPEESENIAKEAALNGRHYLNVAYNFFYGVKPGDPQLEIKLPELSFPKDFSELIDLSVKLGSTIKQAIMPPPAKEEKPATK